MNETAKKPRGRPRAYEPQVALRQATGAFWKSGYAATSLDDITAATGMNRPSLRAAFGDKRAIYLQALAGYWELQLVATRKALDGDHALETALMRVYDAALAIYFSGDGPARGCFVVGTAITEAVDDPEVRRSVMDGFRTLDTRFEARLRRARDSGELGSDTDPTALALLATATLHTLALRARAGTSRKDLRTLASKAVGVICG
ncbi:TetR family transcriptional regulator [Rhodanobacter sp. Root480]|uniref:TetR/AcrR family transcriptional regulator n=1 Tax=Rhodanobacter sp. Root480 TaxID=1736542 RepID=UPI0006F7ADCF|nr:TetR/AcrR family transcriptional regulator [Rhodanobacter sp. Root480]KQX97472.1 TetR family transcriptional regulator [Rhodanobacter sp. Root480]